MSHRGKEPARILVKETHEPPEPQNWPDGHVAVVLTGDDQGERFRDDRRLRRNIRHLIFCSGYLASNVASGATPYRALSASVVPRSIGTHSLLPVFWLITRLVPYF